MGSTQLSGGTNAVDLLDLAGVTTLAVGGTATAFSQSFIIPKSTSYGLEYQFTSPGVVDVNVIVEHSNAVPVTEGASDTNFVVGDGVANLATNVADELVHFVAVSPVVCSYIRFRFVGQGVNNAGTVVARIKLNLSENK